MQKGRKEFVMDNRINKLEDFTKNPFVVPDNFFEKFNEEIMTKLPPKQPQKIKFSFRKYVLPWLAAAALMSGVIFTFKSTLFPSTHSQKTAISKTNDQEEFASSEDQDFYLYLEDDAARKEFTSGSLAGN